MNLNLEYIYPIFLKNQKFKNPSIYLDILINIQTITNIIPKMLTQTLTQIVPTISNKDNIKIYTIPELLDRDIFDKSVETISENFLIYVSIYITI